MQSSASNTCKLTSNISFEKVRDLPSCLISSGRDNQVFKLISAEPENILAQLAYFHKNNELCCL